MGFISSFFTDVLDLIFSVVQNYGWSVVLFTILVRLVLLPLDIKSKKSMRAMSKIQPKMQAIQKKYANDKQKQNLKMQELYKKEKVSPMAGCLPMLIQLPVLWLMFSAMRSMADTHTVQMLLDLMNGEEVVLQNWLWIKNVFMPDSFMSTILPAAGDTLKSIQAVANSAILTEENLTLVREFLQTPAYAEIAASFGANNFIAVPLNLLFFKPTLVLPTSFAAVFNSANGLFILPVLAAVSQFVMTKLSGTQQSKPNPNEPPAPGANAMNSGFMKWFFPLFSLFICASYNAAFAIYWATVNIVQIIQQYLINMYYDKKDRQKELMNPEG